MTNQTRTTLQLSQKNGVSSKDDPIVFVNNFANSDLAQTALISVHKLLSNTANLHVVTANLEISVRSSDPANSSALTVQQGTIFFTNSYAYFAVANNTLKRVSISSF